MADDPALAADAFDGESQGRLWTVPVQSLGRPSVRLLAAPAAWTSAETVTFEYTSTPGATFKCRLDEAEVEPCDGTTVIDGLESGTYVFEIYATSPRAGAGSRLRRVFVVDRETPDVKILAPLGRIGRPGPARRHVRRERAARQLLLLDRRR